MPSIVMAIGLSVPGTVRAQAMCASPAALISTPVSARAWPAPLDRVISVDTRDVVLRDALDRMAKAARLRLSYSAELLPLDRRVCPLRAATSVGDILTSLLGGLDVEPIVVGGDHVVLAPRRVLLVQRRQEPATSLSNVLAAVTVTGRAGSASRESVLGSTVIDGRVLVEHDARTLAQALDAMVPGLWVWDQSPSSLAARYGSIRGASSFGVNAPKVYVDGIEVANAVLFTQFDPRAVERVEIIRGPQGAALYGADAISGVINVVTRHDGADSIARGVEIGSVAGRTESAFANGGVLAQHHTFSLRSGSPSRTAGLSLSFRTLGEFVPGAYSREFSAAGDLRLLGARSSLDVTTRVFTTHAGWPTNPFLTTSLASRLDSTRRGFAADSTRVGRDSLQRALIADLTSPQAMTQYTTGARAMLAADDRWTHTATLGFDGYRLSNVAFDPVPMRSATDSALRAARGGADRGTFRLTSVANFGENSRAAARLTIAAEHSVVRDESSVFQPALTITGSAGSVTSDAQSVAWRRNSGLVAETKASFRDAIFMTAGLRLDRSSGFLEDAQYALLPMLGAAAVAGSGERTIKFRAAYGKGIRPAYIPLNAEPLGGGRQSITSAGLAPEQQSGIEAGFDLTWTRSLSLSITRFDQRASGLIQSVPVIANGGGRGTALSGSLEYELQNVGEIANRGWEMQARVVSGRLSLTGTYSIVDSRVVRLADGYLGDLRPGDRMLEVPARTGSLTARFAGARWSTSLTASRAWDWVNYDAMALAQEFATGTRSLIDFTGSALRDFWREYHGVNRLRGTGSRELFGGLSLVLSGDNLLGEQRGEPDNLTILPGRTISLGLRAKF